MNKIYKVIWNRVKNCYVVVSEIAKREGKSGAVQGGTFLRAMIISSLCMGAAFLLPTMPVRADSIGTYHAGDLKWDKDKHNKAEWDPNHPVTDEDYGSIGVRSGKARLSFLMGLISGETVAGKEGGLAEELKHRTAIGNKFRVFGFGATAYGYGTNAVGEGSLAVGHAATTNGNEGTAIGSYAKVLKGQGTVVGANSWANDQAVALGADVRAQGYASISIGSDDADPKAFTGSKFSDKLPEETIKKIYKDMIKDNPDWFKNKYMIDSTGNDRRVWSPNYAAGEAAIAIGARTVALGDASTSIGVLSMALAERSTALGVRSLVSKDAKGGMALGEESRVMSKDGLAVGNKTYSSGDGSLAYGYDAKALGANSIAIGHNVGANAMLNSEAQNTMANVLLYNGEGKIKPTGTSFDTTQDRISYLEKVMNGYDKKNKQWVDDEGSVLRQWKDGNNGPFRTEYRKKQVQTGPKQWSDNAIAIGRRTYAIGDNSLVLGSLSLGAGNNSLNVGHLTYTKGENSSAIGMEAAAIEDNSMAIGVRSFANLENSIAIGVGSKTDYTKDDLDQDGWAPRNAITFPSSTQVGVISVGKIGSERRISNVASGYRDTDAVNVSQLRALEERFSSNLPEDSVLNPFSYLAVDKMQGDVTKVIPLQKKEMNYRKYVNYRIKQIELQVREKNKEKVDETFKNRIQNVITNLEKGDNKTGIDASGLKGKNVDTVLRELKTKYPELNTSDTNDVINKLNEWKKEKLKDSLKKALTNDEQGFLEGTNYLNDGAKGKDAIAVGYKAQSLADNSIAIGKESRVEKGAQGGIALGALASATRAGGQRAYDFDNDRVFDDDNAAGRGTGGIHANKSDTGALSIGRADYTRQITNVAGGSEDTDAVNVAQLKRVNTKVNNVNTKVEGNIGFNIDGNTGVHGPWVSAGTKASQKGKISLKIRGGDNDSNISVDLGRDNDTIEAKINLNHNLNKLESATFTKDKQTSTLNQDGLTIGSGKTAVALTKDGLNMGGHQIHGVTAGTAGTDAVNVTQMNTTIQATAEALKKNEIKTAQDTATAANSTATQANSTANTANSTANTAKLTAEQAKGAADKVNKELAAYKTEVTKNLNNKANTGLDNLTQSGKTVVKNLAKEQIDTTVTETFVTDKVKKGSVNSTTLTVTGDGKVVSADLTLEIKDKAISKGKLSDELVKEIEGKATKDEVANKAEKTYVDNQLNTKVNTSDFDTYKGKVTTDLAGKADVTGGNITAPGKWAEKLGTGTVAENDTNLVTGGTVQAALKPVSDKADKNETNITTLQKGFTLQDANKTVGQQTVKAGSTVKVTGDKYVTATVNANGLTLGLNEATLNTQINDQITNNTTVKGKMDSWKLKATGDTEEQEIKDGNTVTFAVAEAGKGLTVSRDGNTIKYGIDGSKIDLTSNTSITNINNTLKADKATVAAGDYVTVTTTTDAETGNTFTVKGPKITGEGSVSVSDIEEGGKKVGYKITGKNTTLAAGTSGLSVNGGKLKLNVADTDGNAVTGEVDLNGIDFSNNKTVKTINENITNLQSGFTIQDEATPTAGKKVIKAKDTITFKGDSNITAAVGTDGSVTYSLNKTGITNTLNDTFAKVDASNVGDAERTAWAGKLGTGTVAANDGNLVTGGTVQAALKPVSEKADKNVKDIAGLTTRVGKNESDIQTLQGGFTLQDANKTVGKQTVTAGSTVKVTGDKYVTATVNDNGLTLGLNEATLNNQINTQITSNSTVTGKMSAWKLKATGDTAEQEIKDGNTVTFAVAEAGKGLTVSRDGNTIKYGIDGSKIDLTSNTSITNINTTLKSNKATVAAGDYVTVKTTTDAETGNTFTVNGPEITGEGSVSVSDIVKGSKKVGYKITGKNTTLKAETTGLSVADGKLTLNVADTDNNTVTGEVDLKTLDLSGNTTINNLDTKIENITKTNGLLDNKADKDASNIGETERTAWAGKLGTGKVEANDANLVTGGTVQAALKPVSDKADQNATNIATLQKGFTLKDGNTPTAGSKTVTAESVVTVTGDDYIKTKVDTNGLTLSMDETKLNSQINTQITSNSTVTGKMSAWKLKATGVDGEGTVNNTDNTVTFDVVKAGKGLTVSRDGNTIKYGIDGSKIDFSNNDMVKTINGNITNLQEGFTIQDEATPMPGKKVIKAKDTITFKSGANLTSKVGDDGSVTYGLNSALTNMNSITFAAPTPAPGATSKALTIDGTAGTITGLTNTTWNANAITSGRAATEDQLKALSETVSGNASSSTDYQLVKAGTTETKDGTEAYKADEKGDITLLVQDKNHKKNIEKIIISDVASKNVVDKMLNEGFTVGEAGQPGKDGKDGTIGVNGKDGSSVVINGKDGSIGMKGKDGANGKLFLQKVPGLDGADGETRMVYEADGKENVVATKDDGFFVEGDMGDKSIKQKLNTLLRVRGGNTDEKELTENNIGVVGSTDRGLDIKLAKNLKKLESAEFTKTVTTPNGDVTTVTTINDNGLTIGNNTDSTKNVSLTKDGLNMAEQEIKNVKESTTATSAATVGQVEKAKTELTTSITNKADYALAKGDGQDGAYKVTDGKITLKVKNKTKPNEAAEEVVIDDVASKSSLDTLKEEMKKNIQVGVKGADGADGVDGTIGVNGKDGSSVTINGKDGSIGLNGTNGQNGLTIRGVDGKNGENGEKGVDGKDINRIVTVDPNGTRHQLATLDDGLKFAGNSGNFYSKLNETVEIVGGVTIGEHEKAEDKLTDENIGVVAEKEKDKNGKLDIKLAKNLRKLESAEFTKTVQNGGKVETETTIINEKGILTKDKDDNISFTSPTETIISDAQSKHYITLNKSGITINDEGDGTPGSTKPATSLSSGSLTGLSNTIWDSKNITSGRAATEDQLKQVSDTVDANAKAATDFRLVKAGTTKDADGTEDYTVSENGKITLTVQDKNHKDQLQEIGITDVARKSDVDKMLKDGFTVGKAGKDGTDGKVEVVGKDGSAVVINGKDGSIGLNGTNGQNGLSIRGEKGTEGKPGVDGTTTIKRIVIADPTGQNPHSVATLDDGLRFAGNVGNFYSKLNETVEIVGGVTVGEHEKAEDKLTDENIGVVANKEAGKNGKLDIKLAKNLKDLSSATFTKTVKHGDKEETTSTVINDMGTTVTDKDGNTNQTTAGGTVIQNKDGKEKVEITKDGITITDVEDGTLDNPKKKVSLTKDGLNMGGQEITNIKESTTVTSAATVGQVNAAKKEAMDTLEAGFDVKAGNVTGTVSLKANAKPTIEFLSAGNGLSVDLLTDATTHTQKVIYRLSDTPVFGEKAVPGEAGKPGKDGKVEVVGKDGSAVVINGKDGSIGLKGKDGKDGIGINGKDGGSITIHGTNGTDGQDGQNGLTIRGVDGKNGEKGEKGVDGTTTINRIVTVDPDGKTHQVATLDDGLKFAGDSGDAIAKKLNETVTISGGVTDETKLSDNNIGVVAKDGKLNVKLAKNLTGLESAMFTDKDGNTNKTTAGGTVIQNKDGSEKVEITKNGITITDAGDGTLANPGKTISLTKDGFDNGGNRITNIAKGTADNDAATVGQVNEVKNTIGKDISNLKAGFKIKGSTGESNVALGSDTAPTIEFAGDGNLTSKVEKGKITYSLNNKITIGGEKDKKVIVDGTTGTITGLTNTKWDKDHVTEGRAATEGQLNDVQTSVQNEIKELSDKAVTYKDKEKSEIALAGTDGTKITNLKDGNIAKDSKDAVNGGQLFAAKNDLRLKEGTVSYDEKTGNGVMTLTQGDGETPNKVEVKGLQNTYTASGRYDEKGKKIEFKRNDGKLYNVDMSPLVNGIQQGMNVLQDKVVRAGASSAALASLHPLEYDPDDKWDVAAGVGNYMGANAVAIGAFYRPNENTMFSMGGSFGSGHNMVNAGVSLKVGRGIALISTKAVMAREIIQLKENSDVKDEEIRYLKEKEAKHEEQIQQLMAMVTALQQKK